MAAPLRESVIVTGCKVVTDPPFGLIVGVGVVGVADTVNVALAVALVASLGATAIAVIVSLAEIVTGVAYFVELVVGVEPFVV
jgi:hypothetical protein